MGCVPACCILRLEDLDAAFTLSTSRNGQSTNSPEPKTATAATTPFSSWTRTSGGQD
ncbi:hypothetical protein HGRIS_001454 [Hohenbuehelia grisea]|uniref:Uncharacterized protein n=1 Tax=Hohenbuehelia grisea TaxID=104357 RepID=A0ABR3J9S1_9AGAR